MLTRSRTSMVAALLGALALPSVVAAQDTLLPGGDGPWVQLELAKPFFDDGDEVGFITSILDATVVVPTGGPTLFAGLGLSHATLESTFSGSTSSTTLSNPRIGALFGSAGGMHAEVHADLPLAKEFGDDDFATGVAVLTHYERAEQFLPDSWSLGASLARESGTEGNVFGGRVGAAFYMPTDDFNDEELFTNYALFASIPAGSARVGAEVSGRAILSEDDADLGERTTFFLTLTGALPNAGVEPELYARLPLDDDFKDVFDVILGVRVRLGR